MDFFGSQWQSITMDSLLLLFPEERSKLSQLEVYRLEIVSYPNSPSVVWVWLVTPGRTTDDPGEHFIVSMERFSSASRYAMEAVESSLSKPLRKDRTPDK